MRLRRALLALIGAAILATAAHAAEPAGTLARIAQSGVLRVCTTGDYTPFTLLAADGSYAGIDIDLAHDLGRVLEARVEFVKTSWPQLSADFVAGKCDIAMGGVSVSLERQRHADFSAPYLVDGKVAIARCSEVERFASLEAIDQPEVRAIVNPGGTNARFAEAHLHHAQVRTFPDNTKIFDEIVRGAADVMITDGSETLMQHKLHPELCAVHPERPFTYGEKAYLLPSGDSAFKDFVDQWLHLAAKSGQLQTILDRGLR